MGKNTISVIFLVFSGVSLFVFFHRDNKILREKVDRAERLPRVILEDFTIYTYNEHEVQSTLTGKIAHFLDPNILEVYGDIRGLKHNSSKREHFSAESATVLFSAKGIVRLLEDSRIETCELENKVRVGSGDDVILTEYAKYFSKRNQLRSDVPVHYSNPTARLMGKNGFVYDIDRGDLDIIGPIKGTLQGEATTDF